MTKNKKRLLPGMIAAVMTFTALPYTAAITATQASAEERTTAESEALKAAIADVRGRVNVPKECTEFKYETNKRYDTVYYVFYWYSKGDRRRYFAGEQNNVDKMISVEYSDGMITNASYEDGVNGYYTKSGFAKLSPEEQEKAARKHFKALNPDLKGNVEFTRNTSSSNLRSRSITYSIRRKEYGVYMDSNYGSISVNRDTGELISFRLSWYNDAKPQDASKAISQKEANEAYKKLTEMTDPYYYYFINYLYNEKTGEYDTERFVLPVYDSKNNKNDEIDAFTGKYTARYDDMKKYSYTDAYTWSTTDGFDEVLEEESEEMFDDAANDTYGSYAFTEAELSAIADESDYISEAEAKKLLKENKFIKFDDKLILKSRKVRTAEDDDGKPYAKMNLSYSFTSEKEEDIYLDVEMNAHTGEIIYFTKSYGNYSSRYSKEINDSSAKKTAEDALKLFMGDKAAKYKFTDSSKMITGYNEKTGADRIFSKQYEFERYENGLPAPFDKARFEVDSNGELLYFNYSYHNVSFPKPTNLVSKDKCFEDLFEHMTPDLKYTGFRDLQMKSHIYLTYIYDSSFSINALTGERINSSGKPYYTEEKAPVTDKEIHYTDIKGHKYEKEIKTLAEYGVTLTDDDKLRPDEDITVGEFVRLLSSAFDENSPYRFKTDAQREAYYRRKLTHSELAKLYILEFSSSSSDTAELKGIFKSPFSDVSENDPNCGYIAIAKAEGYIKGKSGAFKPNAGITKAEALKITYDYLAGDNDKDLYELFVI